MTELKSAAQHGLLVVMRQPLLRQSHAVLFLCFPPLPPHSHGRWDSLKGPPETRSFKLTQRSTGLGARVLRNHARFGAEGSSRSAGGFSGGEGWSAVSAASQDRWRSPSSKTLVMGTGLCSRTSDRGSTLPSGELETCNSRQCYFLCLYQLCKNVYFFFKI